jgi:hypothetical protein
MEKMNTKKKEIPNLKRHVYIIETKITFFVFEFCYFKFYENISSFQKSFLNVAITRGFIF